MSTRWRRPVFVGCLSLVSATLCALVLYDVLARAEKFLRIESEYAYLLVPFRWFAIGTCLLALAVVGLRWRRLSEQGREATRVGLPLRGCFYMVLFAFAAASAGYAWSGFAWMRFPILSIFFSTLLLGLSVWTCLLVVFPDGFFRRPRGAWAVVDVILMNAVLLLVVSEAAVTLQVRFFPTRLLWDDASVVTWIDANRQPPGKAIYGFEVNNGGFHDDEFFRADADDFVVALLADSFGVGIVPYKHNFASVLERKLQAALSRPNRRVAVHNFGVGSIGMAGYAWLLEKEALATNPSLVVLAVFVGNDIDGFERENRGYYCLQQLRVYDAVQRMLAVAGEAVAGGRFFEIGFLQRETEAVMDGRYLPGVQNEKATFSESRFLRLEKQRVEKCNIRSRENRGDYEAFVEALDYFHRRLGDQLLVVLIPDEYQVNDELYEALMQRVGDRTAYDREYPQRRITAFARENGITVLDLLPLLREENQVERTYHLRDSHWNARGNRIGGEAIAEFILREFGPLLGPEKGA